jgi:hypothetical protein
MRPAVRGANWAGLDPNRDFSTCGGEMPMLARLPLTVAFLAWQARPAEVNMDECMQAC